MGAVGWILLAVVFSAILLGLLILWFRHATRDVDAEY
jgi:hypothetical protein